MGNCGEVSSIQKTIACSKNCGVFVQGFNWESWRNPCWYEVLHNDAAELAAAGITDIWLPPPSQSVAPQGKGSARSGSGCLPCLIEPLLRIYLLIVASAYLSEKQSVRNLDIKVGRI